MKTENTEPKAKAWKVDASDKLSIIYSLALIIQIAAVVAWISEERIRSFVPMDGSYSIVFDLIVVSLISLLPPALFALILFGCVRSKHLLAALTAIFLPLMIIIGVASFGLYPDKGPAIVLIVSAVAILAITFLYNAKKLFKKSSEKHRITKGFVSLVVTIAILGVTASLIQWGNYKPQSIELLEYPEQDVTTEVGKRLHFYEDFTIILNQHCELTEANTSISYQFDKNNFELLMDSFDGKYEGILGTVHFYSFLEEGCKFNEKAMKIELEELATTYDLKYTNLFDEEQEKVDCVEASESTIEKEDCESIIFDDTQLFFSFSENGNESSPFVMVSGGKDEFIMSFTDNFVEESPIVSPISPLFGI